MCIFQYQHPYNYKVNLCNLLEIYREPVVCSDCRKCKFHKSPKDFFDGRFKAYERIATLPKLKQQQIADKYYNGRMVWNNEKYIQHLNRFCIPYE